MKRSAHRLRDVKILTVVGNRPQFVKAAAVSGPLRERHEEVLVHTGQHYDDSLSRVFFAELGLARPDRELGIGGGTNTEQTARMLAALEPLLVELAPAAALVYGDTNSTLAGALAAAQAGVPVVHVEAGMRSFDSAHARGAQPRADRSSRRAAAVRIGRRRREPARRVRARADRGRRRRDGRRGDAPSTLGARRRRRARSAAGAQRRVPAADGAPRGQRRRSRAFARVDRSDRSAAGAGRVPAAPAHARAAARRRARGTSWPGSTGCASASRSATSSSARCCVMRGPC